MNPESPKTRSLLRNWLSFAGGVVALGSFFAFLLLSALDLFAHFRNPYVGILAYVIAPGFLFLGLFMIFGGVWIQRRHARQAAPNALPGVLAIDLSRPRDRRTLRIFIVCSVVFLLCTAIGSYQTYHLSESVQFCGQACHTPMKPEFTAYLNSPHARVACVECHVGNGAKAFVAAKLNGVHQLVGVLTDHYQHPIATPIRNLRPAQETCEQCHWPKKFDGNLDRTFSHFLSDETNTPFAVRLLLHVGGADPAHGPAGGIHWHVSKENKIEYIATDAKRQVIPWVRVTDAKGVVTVYKTPGFTNDPAQYQLRRMDCIDCHNRPAHRFRAPDDAVDLALTVGSIDRALPWVKSNAMAVLVKPYTTTPEALTNIDHTLRAVYSKSAEVDQLVTAVQTIYSQNFFPEMKADWRAYPENVGHKNWPGCFRCHDGSHKAVNSEKTIPASNCTSCHTIVAQGAGDDLNKLNGKGDTFFHIDAEYENFDCNSCHTGGPMTQ
ncbi:MAG TPA: NapC/NirT family cytochrome c [Dongiaceae bacterium]|nr:NapC/NirT family cytochrome c [Dongiaceae bacterium]